jgi:hypothetical protein
MSVKKRTFVFVALALLVWSVVATGFAGYYYSIYSDLRVKTRKPIIYVNIGINYGNGTIEWFNGTEARAGDTLLDIIILVATTVNYTAGPSGAFVNSINGVSYSGSYYWMWWMWTTWGWFEGQVASDKYMVGDGETLYWYYEDTSIFPLPKPS